MNVIKNLACLLLLFVTVTIRGQEIPPIKIFTPQDYRAEDQNWAITQAPNDFIYAANNSGLLEFNGASWHLYASPNNDILRSAKVVDDKIYTGGYMDFGYWTKNEFGDLSYTSLLEEKGLEAKEDEEIWGIIDLRDYVLFQSFETIYIYDLKNETFRLIQSQLRINKIFKVNNAIFFQKRGGGLFKIENGEAVQVISADRIGDFEIINIFDTSSGLVLLSKEKGFFRFSENNITKWNVEADVLLSRVNVYSGLRLKNGNFVLGTISHGLLVIEDTGELVFNIGQSKGLSNNTILSLEEDSFGNVWLGLDNGINVLNLNSPFRVYTDKLGVLGTVYTSARFDNFLYLGTNQGLFYKSIETNEQFSLIDGTKGQVWSLRVYDNTLFCGHDKGTFIVKNNVAQKISSEIGTWDIKKIPERTDILICGKYKGINILEKVNNEWVFKNKIDGFDISSRYFEFASSNKILVSHEYKGVYVLNVDSDYETVLDYKKDVISEGVKSSIVKYNNSIIYCLKNGVYEFDVEKEKFIRDTLLSGYLSNENYLSGKLIADENDKKLWGFPKDKIVYIEPGKLTDKPIVNTISLQSEIRKSKPGYENLLHLGDNNYLIGTTQGYFIVDLNKPNVTSNKIYINSVVYNSKHNQNIPLKLNESPLLKNKENSLKFKYSVANYDKLSSIKYQHRLIGIYNNWSQWSSDSEIFFNNLPHGNYKFEVRALVDGVVSDNIMAYDFEIKRPWYLTSWAIAFYVLSGLGIMLLIHYLNKRHYKKQKQELIEKKERERELEQLENQSKIVEFKNKNLELDIENKNRELGMATMNLVKRNELLNNIKVELTRSKSTNDIKDVIRLINSSLNNTSDWKLFEEAFNNADKDFMKRVKALHPSITPNDLRLCAYLRLNLSSKEIAPLLNISHKSVEVKRYRLRKKMGLDHDQSLSNYIIEL